MAFLQGPVPQAKIQSGEDPVSLAVRAVRRHRVAELLVQGLTCRRNLSDRPRLANRHAQDDTNHSFERHLYPTFQNHFRTVNSLARRGRVDRAQMGEGNVPTHMGVATVGP